MSDKGTFLLFFIIFTTLAVAIGLGWRAGLTTFFALWALVTFTVLISERKNK